MLPRISSQDIINHRLLGSHYAKSAKQDCFSSVNQDWHNRHSDTAEYLVDILCVYRISYAFMNLDHW